MIRVYIPVPESFYYDPVNDNFYYKNSDFDENFRRAQTPIDNNQMLRLIKGLYANYWIFEKQFLRRLPEHELLKPIRSYILKNYNQYSPFSISEALELKNSYFRKKVLSTIPAAEFVAEFDSKRLKVAGKRVKRKVYNSDGEITGEPVYDVVFETYEIDVSRIKSRGKQYFYALKVWCTTTLDEHWLWIEEKYKDDPLQAIASTFHIHDNLLPHIKEIKRQGDVLLVELTKDVSLEGNTLPLTKEQYFGFLTSET